MTCTRFALSLVEHSDPADRCPHLRGDDAGPYCAHVLAVIPDLPGAMASRNVCDSASLQRWCLAGPRCWPRCHFHPEWSDAS